MKKLVLFLFVLMLALTSFVACEDTENTGAEDSVKYDIFRDTTMYIDQNFHFSNSLYDLPVYSMSPYYGIKEREEVKKELDAEGEEEYRMVNTTEYDADGLPTRILSEESYDKGTSLDTLVEETYDTSVSPITGENDDETEKYEITVDDNNLPQEVVTDNTEGGVTTTEEFKFDGWDLTKYTTSNEEYDMTKEYKFASDGILPDVTDITANTTRKINYIDDAGRIIRVEHLDSGDNKQDVFELNYNDDGEVNEIIHDDKNLESLDRKYKITWSAGLPKEKVVYQGNADDDSWEETKTITYNFVAGRLSEKTEEYADGPTTEYDYSYRNY